MTFRKPQTFTEWVRPFSPAILIICAAVVGLLAERAVPRGGMTGLLVMLIATIPALVISIASGFWLLRVKAEDDFGQAVKAGMLGLLLLLGNLILALPGCVAVRHWL